MNEMELKYGCNPNQKPARVFMNDNKDLPFQVLSGRPGYINLLDAFNGWQLVRELKKATLNPKPETCNSKPVTHNPKLGTRNQ